MLHSTRGSSGHAFGEPIYLGIEREQGGMRRVKKEKLQMVSQLLSEGSLRDVLKLFNNLITVICSLKIVLLHLTLLPGECGSILYQYQQN